MANGTYHTRSTTDPRRTVCGGVYRKPIMVRLQKCPQCARVEKRGK